MAEVSLLPMNGHNDHLGGMDDNTAMFSQLPLTIDPTCIDTPSLFIGQDRESQSCGSLQRNHNLPAIDTTPIANRRRTPLFLEQNTPPHYMSEPSSAASSFAFSSASGMLTPYTSSTSVSSCSSRRPSIVHIDSPSHYMMSCQGSPSPRDHNFKPTDMSSCVSSTPIRSPHPLYSDNTVSFDEVCHQPIAYRRDSALVSPHYPGPQSFLQELAIPEARTPVGSRQDQQVMGNNAYHPQNLSNLGSLYNSQPNLLTLPGSSSVARLQPAPEFFESAQSINHSWASDPFDSSSQDSSPAWPGNVTGNGISTLMSPAKMTMARHTRARDDCRVSKSVRPQRKCTARIVDAGLYEIQDRTAKRSSKPATVFKCPHPGCHQRFGRPEHCNRHQMIHDPAGKEVLCPLCDKGIKQRRDNLKAHIVRTHFTPAEKKKTEKMNARHSMKEIFERLRDPYALSGKEQDLWLDIFKKPSDDDLYPSPDPSGLSSPVSSMGNRVLLDEIWGRVREMDPRFGRLLSNRMTIHDREKGKGDREGNETGKLTKFWKMLGWSIAETQSILASTISSDWDGPSHTTLWDLDPRRKAMMEGSLTLEDAEEQLGVDMLVSREMGLENFDPRWIALHTGQMSLDEAEKCNVGQFHPSWQLKFAQCHPMGP